MDRGGVQLLKGPGRHGVAPEPRHFAIGGHRLRAAQGFQRLQEGGQAFLPGAAALEARFNGGQGERRGAGGQRIGHGAHLLGQGGGPGVLLWFGLLWF